MTSVYNTSTNSSNYQSASSNHMLAVTKQQLVALAMCWLGFPVVLYFINWIHLFISIPILALIIMAIWHTIKSVSDSTKDIIYINKKFYIGLLLILIYVLGCGIGGYSQQPHWDNMFRNAVFQDLVNHQWPVVNIANDGEPEMLCYYFAFWLPAALFAKITSSLEAGYAFQVFYAWIGLSIAVLTIFGLLKRRTINYLVLFLLTIFCCWDSLMYICIGGKFDSLGDFYKLKDLCTNFFSAPPLAIIVPYIYNQGVASWLGLGLLWLIKEQRDSLLFVYSLMFAFAPFPVIGMAPLMAYWLLKDFKASLHFNNFVGFVIFIIFGLVDDKK